jgi:hypothetical protein
LTEGTFAEYLGDLQTLSNTRDIKFQFVTGGEPTLWRGGNAIDIVDILAACHRLECVGLVTMPTNGRRFENREFAFDFVQRLSSKTSRPTLIGVSIASYQNNLTESGCAALENLLSACSQPRANAVPVILVTLSAKDDIYERLEKLYPEVTKRVTALAPLGVAEHALSECPSLVLSQSDKSPLGSYLPHFMRDVMGKLRLSEADFFAINNGDLMDRLSRFNNCGDSPFIDHRWRYCLPFRGDTRFDLGEIGTMTANALEAFVDRYPALGVIRKLGVISAAKCYKRRLSAETAEKFAELLSGASPVSVAYRGCMVCKKLKELGVIDEMLDRPDAPRLD